jgi:fructokinase
MASYGLIEAGGTKFVLGIADGEGQLAATHRIATTTPQATIGASLDWFREQGLAPAAIGIGSFGPLELDPTSPQWGHVGKTPKPGWTGADLVTPFADAFGCPVGIETDVNAAALAEARWGAGVGHASLLYLTIGTGIGGGLASDGRVLRGLAHPEMGHIRVPRHPADHDFAGICPFHGDCLEGLACGPANVARWGMPLSSLDEDHPGKAIAAWYLGHAVVTFQAVMQPARIVLGGGVMGAAGLLDMVRREAVGLGSGYFAGNAEEIVVAPGLGDRSGLMGALAIAVRSTSA